MTPFLVSNIILVCFFITYLIIKGNTRQFNLNRWYLLLGPLAALVLPYFQFESVSGILPSIVLPEINAITKIKSQPDTFSVITLFYLFGCIATLLHVSFRLYKIKQLPNTESLLQVGSIKIVQSPFNYSFSFGNTIYLHSNDHLNTELVVLHEMAHCTQKHSLDILWINGLKVIFWFNPFIYLWEKAIKENHEFLADDYVIQKHSDKKEYMTTLVESNYNGSFPHLAIGFNTASLLRKRIKKMKLQNNNKMKHFILIPVAVVGTVLFTSMNNKIELKSTENTTVQATEEVINPSYKGGMEAMIAFIQANLNYPKNLTEQEGKVLISFIVRENGKVDKVEVANSSNFKEFDDEAVRLVSLMTEWEPGTKNGKAIDVEMKLPIIFTTN